MLLESSNKREVLTGIINLINAVSFNVDLRQIGGVKSAGELGKQIAVFLKDPKVDFYIIDQSVTGMYERKTRVSL